MNYFKTFSAIVICVLVISGCSSKSGKTDSAQAATQETGKAAIPVKVKALSKTKIGRTLDYTATVLPYYEVNVVPSAPGRIEKIYVQVGDRIKKGDDLFLMDRTQLFQQKVQLSSLAKDLARLDTLLKTGSAKQQQYDQLKTQYDVTKTNVEFMEQNTSLKSPFDGIVTGKYFENGEMYSGTPTTQSGRSAVVTVMQINPLKINVSISEQYYPMIKRGMKAEVVADVYKNEKFNAQVFRIYPTVNASTRSFIVELELQNRNDLLKPGMYVRVSMDLGEVDTFVVPANTVLVQEGTNIRFVFIDKGNVAERIEVEIGKRYDDKLEIITDKIKEGDRLVTDGQARLISGDKLDVKN
jgi:membrane fusion protein, multidrug efflux system